MIRPPRSQCADPAGPGLCPVLRCELCCPASPAAVRSVVVSQPVLSASYPTAVKGISLALVALTGAVGGLRQRTMWPR